MYSIGCQKENDFYYVKIRGKINHVQIIEFLEKIYEYQKQSKFLRVMTDYTDAVIDESNSEPIKKIATFFNSKFMNSSSQIFWSNVSTSYLPTTGAMILKSLVEDKQFQYKPFSTLSAALVWMGLTMNDFNELQTLFVSD